MRLIDELRSQLQYKIILPFLLLTLLVALAGSAVSFLFIAGTAQERLNNQLAQLARDTSDDLVNLENTNLQFLREAAFAGPNAQTGAPAVAAAVAAHNQAGLEEALDPYFRVSISRPGVRADRLIVFDNTGNSVIDWERPANASDSGERVRHPGRDLRTLWFVKPILGRQSDPLGDKYAGLLDLGEASTRYLFTVAPILDDDKVVGGLLIATRLNTLLTSLSEDASAAIVTLYQAEDGRAFASSENPADGLQVLNLPPDLVARARDMELARNNSVLDTSAFNGRSYQFAYAPLRIRSNVIGIISVALASDYVVGPWAAARIPLMVLTVALMLAIIGLGLFVARLITRPLQELVVTAQEVTGGNLTRRSHVTVHDEVGQLAHSFNQMTEHLITLYNAVQAEASQRAAIVESIAEGIVVCDLEGDVLVLNRTMRTMLGLADGDAAPQRYEDIPLQPLTDGALAFGEERTPDLFNLRDQIVRVVVAPVLGEDHTRLGDVYVLRDLTSEVAVDRAKTNFIATISHELRTPLTVLGGSSELILRGLVGPINDDQRSLLDSMRRHTLTMTTLLNNVITIAGLESGTLTFELEPVQLSDVVDELMWSVRSAISAKGLKLEVDLPNDLPEVMADMQQLRNVLSQLLDNARRYTEAGGVTLRATRQGNLVRVDVSDTGPGITPELSEHLFTRFTRGSQGINSTERGIGLGLAIAKMLVERQGGTIWLDQTSEQGSTFSFTLRCIDADPHYNDSTLASAA